MKWDIAYRRGDAGEIEAVVEADDEEEAIKKFLNGDVKEITVNYWVLWPDLIEATPQGGAPNGTNTAYIK